MRPRPLIKVQALLLAALTAGLASGVPSHHHERPDAGPIVADAGHHGHGSQLVEQGDRQTSETVTVALPAPPMLDAPAFETAVTTSPVPAPRPVARGQPPPSDRPRAPPVSV